jgi:hypothetical protein
LPEPPNPPARVPANNPHAARERYVDYLQRTLSCVSTSVWQVGPAIRAATDGEWTLFLPGNNPITLRSEAVPKVRLFASQRFVTIPDALVEGEYKTSTREYVYHLWDGEGDPVLEWHWHPSRTPEQLEPHLHAHPHAESGHPTGWGERIYKFHIPTERVAFELIDLFLIERLGVTPARADWRESLDEGLRAFRQWRTWPAKGGGLAEPMSLTVPAAPPVRPKRSRRPRS